MPPLPTQSHGPSARMDLLSTLALAALCLAACGQGPKIPKVTFKRVFADYPLRVFEAQGSVLGTAAGGYSLMVAGGFKNFPGVTNHTYTRPLTSANAPWKRVADMPVAVTHMAQLNRGSMFCGAGGYLGRHPGASTNTVYCFEIGTGRWTRLPDLPGDRAGGGLVLRRGAGVNELIYAGGVDRVFNSFKEHNDYGTTWVLNLNNQAAGWVDQKASMPDPRNHMGAVNACGRYIWVGGQYQVDEHKGNSATVSEWLPAQKKWSSSPPAKLPYGLGHVSASVMAYKCGIVVVAGMRNGRMMSNNVLYWEPTKNKWHFIGKYTHDSATPVCGLHGDQIMCATAGDWSLSNRVSIGTLS